MLTVCLDVFTVFTLMCLQCVPTSLICSRCVLMCSQCLPWCVYKCVPTSLLCSRCVLTCSQCLPWCVYSVFQLPWDAHGVSWCVHSVWLNARQYRWLLGVVVRTVIDHRHHHHHHRHPASCTSLTTALLAGQLQRWHLVTVSGTPLRVVNAPFVAVETNDWSLNTVPWFLDTVPGRQASK